MHRLSVCHAVTGIGDYRVYLALLMPVLWLVPVKGKSSLQNPGCDGNVSYYYEGMRAEEHFCALLGIQIEIWWVRIILLVNLFFSISFYGLNMGND